MYIVYQTDIAQTFQSPASFFHPLYLTIEKPFKPFDVLKILFRVFFKEIFQKKLFE